MQRKVVRSPTRSLRRARSDHCLQARLSFNRWIPGAFSWSGLAPRDLDLGEAGPSVQANGVSAERAHGGDLESRAISWRAPQGSRLVLLSRLSISRPTRGPGSRMHAPYPARPPERDRPGGAGRIGKGRGMHSTTPGPQLLDFGLVTRSYAPSTAEFFSRKCGIQQGAEADE